jgi:hypothetical protein
MLLISYFRDVLVRPILVHPEGFPVEVTKSAFICPSSKVIVFHCLVVKPYSYRTAGFFNATV